MARLFINALQNMDEVNVVIMIKYINTKVFICNSCDHCIEALEFYRDNPVCNSGKFYVALYAIVSHNCYNILQHLLNDGKINKIIPKTYMFRYAILTDNYECVKLFWQDYKRK